MYDLSRWGRQTENSQIHSVTVTETHILMKMAMNIPKATKNLMSIKTHRNALHKRDGQHYPKDLADHPDNLQSTMKPCLHKAIWEKF